MLEYSDLSIDDLENMRNLYETFLNSGSGIEEWLREGLANPRYAGIKCMDGDKMVGVFSGRPGIEFTYGHEDLTELIREKWKGYEIFTGDMLVVLPEYRGHGIARRLTTGMKKSLREKGCQRMVAEAWYKPVANDIPASNVMKYLGPHEVVGEYMDFYRDIDKLGMTCPECGPGSCRCGAVVCVIEIM